MTAEKNIGYLDVVGVLLCLHQPDREILQRGGLAAFAERYVAYQTVFDKRRVLVLVGRMLKLHERKQLTEQTAREQIVVLERRDQKWAKIWPTP